MQALTALFVLFLGGVALYIGATGTAGNVPKAVAAFRAQAGI